MRVERLEDALVAPVCKNAVGAIRRSGVRAAHRGRQSGQPDAGPCRNQKDGLVCVRIPPGTYIMGCSPADGDCFGWEMAPHRVSIEGGFWIGQTEVTPRAYLAVTGANPSRYKGSDRPGTN
jgi:formylglycine-generating enzyme required for sulfatase activity